MSKRIILKRVVLSLMILTLVGGSSSGAHAEKVLKIGVIASLSGPQAQVGREVADGALLAIQRINEEWKEKGVRMEMSLADEGGSPDQAQEAASRLIRQAKVDLLFGLADSDCALAVLPLVRQAQIPLLTLATHPDLTHPPQRWVFRGSISDEEQAKILVDMLWEKIGNKRIALLYEENAYGRSGAAVQRKRIEQYGETPVAEVSYARGQKDFASPLRQIQGAGAEGILVYGMASDAAPILEGLRELKLDAKVVASSGWDSHRLLDLPPQLTEGVIVGGYLTFAHEGRDEELGPSWTEFAQAFQARFGRDPDVLAALSYSNMMCLAEAYARAGFQTSRLTEGLEQTKGFNTLLETRITYSDESRDGFKFLHLAEIREGKPMEWRRNLFARDYRFRVPSKEIKVGEYQGKTYEAQPGITVWMLLHFAFGRPPFLRELSPIDEYGFKACFAGALFKGQVRVPVFKLVFRSEKEAIEALNFQPPDAEGGERREAEPKDQVSYRDADSGIYTDGTFWAGYKRVKNVVILAEGGIPREDLRMILEADL